MNTELAKAWSKLDNDTKLEIIEQGIQMCDTNEGFLMLRYFAKAKSVCAYITTKIDNHFCSEAVSQDTLFQLFGEGHEFEEEDAEVILNWMNEQH